jgi:hypothetical protein
MNGFYLIVLMTLAFSAHSEDTFFTPQNKLAGLKHYKERIYSGCSDLKEKQDPIPPADLSVLSLKIKNRIGESFSQAFKENPKIKQAFENDIDSLSKELSCQREANDCRARLIGLSLFYYQTLRADVSDDSEKRFRKSSLQGVQTSSYGSSGPSHYKKLLLKNKNDLTKEIFALVMHKDKNNLYVCNPVQNGMVHTYSLDLDEPGEYVENLDPVYDPRKNLPKECVEEKRILLQEFQMAFFDEGRNTVGQDQVDPLKQKISQFIKSQPDLIVTDVIVTSSSSKTPLYATINGKKMIDPDSNVKNLSVATERAKYVLRMLNEIKTSHSQFQTINFEARAELAGPEFEPRDLNDRFVTRMTPGYMERIESMYKKYQKEFQEVAMTPASTELFDENKFVNLYQAKFKPFHGFSLVLRGHNKQEMKCLDQSANAKKEKVSTSKQ